MDISFNPVLEGARQYFQGLPSPASNSSQASQPPPAPPPPPPPPPHPVVVDPQPQRPPSSNTTRYDNVPTSIPTTSGAQQSTTTSASPSVLSYWPPPSSSSAFQRKEVAATTMSQAHLVAPSATTHHVKAPNAVFNGSRPSTSEMNQSTYTAPQRPQGHNLPPIAALSNYHSSRSSRDSLTTPRIQPQTSHTSSKGFHRTQQPEYTLPRQNQAQFVSAATGSTARPQYGHQGPKYQQLGVVPSSVPTPTVSASYHSFPTTPTSVSMSSTSSSTSLSSVNPVSSHSQQPQFAYHPLPEQPPKSTSRQPQYPTQQLPYFNTSPAVSTPSQQNAMVNGHQKPPAATPVPARPTTSRPKRESPLDLSVKTVRQSADSTAVDDSESNFNARNYSPVPVANSKNRTPLPPLQLPSSVAYPTMDSRGAPRTPATSNNSTSKSIGAPKIDFLAKFTAHQHSSTPSSYGPETMHRSSDRTHNPQHYPPQHSSTPLPHVGSFKNLAPSGSFDHKQPQSAPYNHTPTQSTPYDSKQTQPVVYNHKLTQSVAAYNHKQAQSALYDNKYAQFTSYNHKQVHPTPFNQKQMPPTTYDHIKQTQPTPYEHSKQTPPVTYEHGKQTQSALYDHSKQTPYDNNKQAQLAPYDQSKQAQPANYDHIKQTQSTPYDQSKPTQPSTYDQGKQTQSASYNLSKQAQIAAYDHSKQPQPASYDHGKQSQAASYNNGKQTQPAPYDHKQTQPVAYDHKQTPPISYDFKKLQLANYDNKPIQPVTYDHSNQPQSSHFNVKHIQSGSFDYKQTQAPAPYDHNNQPHPASFEYKQTYDHKQAQYYPTATQPQHRQPSKPSPGVQTYPSTHFTPPVPAGYDPTKRTVDGPPGYGGGRVEYRQVPNSAAYPNQGLQKRMLGEARHASPAKVPRLDTWRQTIDQQIEQRLSSYASSRQQQQQPVNGNGESNGSTTAQDAQFLQRHQNPPRVTPPQHNLNVTPSVLNPPFPNRGPNLQKMLSSVSTPKSGRIAMPGGGAADKRVLNILRNTLEEKEARMTLLQNQLHHNAQLQQQYQQRQPLPPEAPVQLMHQQKPSLSPTLPPGRLNLPPFGTVVENAHTSQHKLHVPRAIDSVRLDQDSGSQRGLGHKTQAMMVEITRSSGAQQATPGTDLDGFAAYLAARIRTKAELKQVDPGMEHLNTAHHQSFRCPTPSSSVISVSNSSAPSARTTPGTPTVFSPPPVNALSVIEDKTGDISKATATPSTQANAVGGASSSSGSPPKLTRERGVVVPPRRRLFSRTDEEQGAVGVPGVPVLGPVGPFPPPRDLSGLRSSSETSVFDFRDSDSEGEMPVLERQTLNEMRKDRRYHTKQPTQASTSVEEPSENSEKQESADPFWSDTCDKFLEELRIGTSAEGTKRRGRRKKVDAEEKGERSEKVVKSETCEKVVKSEKSDSIVISGLEVKKENNVEDTFVIKKEKFKVECSSNESKKRKVLDSKDVPLRKRRARLKSEDDDVDDEISLAEMKARLGKRRDSVSERVSSESEPSDDESEEKVETVAERLRRRKRLQDEEDSKVGMRLRSKDPSSPRKTSDTPTKSSAKKKKPHFGDGSDFTPGWEEQVYRFKRSLRMPARLINISRPPDSSRLCASLPDLDPCPNSPAASTMDSSDFQQKRNAVASNLLRRWDAESDLESNSNLSMPCESEEATSSSILSNKLKDKKYKIKEKNNSLLNLLVQKYGRTKSPRKKVGENKWLERPGARILPRKTAPELLPTPSLGIGSPKRGPYKKGKTSLKKKSVDDSKNDPYSDIKDSVYLGYFRRKTVTNFRDAFLQNGSSLGSTFAPIVFKSRTRTQTRVMRQRATIREVFGEDRPASCPPTCREESLTVEEEIDDVGRRNSNSSQGRANQAVGRSAALLRSNKAVLNSKRHLLHGGRRRNHNLIRALTTKTLQDLADDVDPKDKNYKLVDLLPQISAMKAIADCVEVADEVIKTPLVKRIKLRTVRRKFRSGFDYIRKKKKQQKKDDGDVPKVKKKAAISRPSSESVQDIQNEIRGWVINKGLGETLLHRAARLGYTDVAAYCLETLDNPASPRDNAGYTPLHEACSRGHLDIARLLLMYGANVSDSAQGGIRPLHEAAESGCMEMMRLLLSYGADPLLATYGGQTPLSLATDEDARRLLQLHLADVQGLPAQPWNFQGPAACCDPVVRGYDVLQDPPCLSPEPLEDDEIEMELSEMALPVLYRLIGEPPSDRWVLLQDLTTLLRVKSKDALLRQLGPEPRSILKELKMADFLEQARCCHLMGSGEKINIRASKVALVPYNDKVREILGVEKVTVSSR